MYELKCFTLPVGKIKPPPFQVGVLDTFPLENQLGPFSQSSPRAPDNQHVFIPRSFDFRAFGLVYTVTSLDEYMTEVVNYNGGWAFRRRGPLLSLAPSLSPSLGHVTQPLWGSVLSPLK